jgi:hypothetical protein
VKPNRVGDRHPQDGIINKQGIVNRLRDYFFSAQQMSENFGERPGETFKLRMRFS